MITHTIIRALLEENSVTISGLGTFSLKKLPSQIKEDIVYPPQNMLEFEYSKEAEGFDFVSKLSKWEQIRIDEAQTQVSEWLNLLEKGLEHNKSLFFDDFGTFSKELSGKIVFQSMLISQLNVENEGFEPVCLLSQINEQPQQTMDKPVIDKRHILVKRKQKQDKIWFAATILATAMLLFALFFKEKIVVFYKTITTKSEIAMVIKDDEPENDIDINNLEEEDTVVVVPVPINKNINKKNGTTIHLHESKDIHLPYEKGKYYVIAGSFTKDEDALRHIKEKKLEKYHAKIIVEPKNPRKRVCIGVFDNEEAAIKFAAQTDKNYWVLK